MPAHSKRDGEFGFARRANNRRLNGCFETGVIDPIEGTVTGERMWPAYNGETSEKIKQSEMAGGNSLDFGASGFPIGQAVLVVHRGREMSGNVCRSSRFSSSVDIRLNDYSETVVTAARRDIKLLEDAEFQRIQHNVDPVQEAEEVTEAYRRRDVLVIDIPNETNFQKQEYNDTEESMAAAVLTSLSLSPVLPTFTFPYGDWDAFEDEVIDTGKTMSVVTEPEKKEENRRTKSRRRKNSFKTLYQCTWPGCGKIFTNSSSIIRHVRLSHLGPKNHDDDGFSDGEEEFYFNEIELNTDENNPRSSQGSISPPLPSANPRRGRSMSDPSRPTQPLVSSKSTHVHVDDNFTWPLRTTTASGGRSKVKRSLHQTVHTNLRKGRGDGRKCRKVYGMENKHLWCTQCRWKKACIKFVD